MSDQSILELVFYSTIVIVNIAAAIGITEGISQANTTAHGEATSHGLGGFIGFVLGFIIPSLSLILVSGAFGMGDNRPHFLQWLPAFAAYMVGWGWTLLSWKFSRTLWWTKHHV